MDKLKQQKQGEFPRGITSKITDFDPGDVGRHVECESERDLLDDQVEYGRRYE